MAFVCAAFAVPNLAIGQFASTKFNPNTQTVNVGTNFSVDVVLSDPPGGYALSGVEVWIGFDATKLQAVSVTTGAGSPFTNVSINQIDNAAGKLRYKATGSTINGSSFTVAKIVFTPIAAGTSVLDITNVNTDIVGYGPFGVNGLAADGSVTIVAPAPTQTLTILGGSGNVGDIAPNVEYYNHVTGNWQPAHLASYAAYGHPVTHPWGNVAGTNHWINYRTDGGSDPRSPLDTSTDWYLYRVRITVPADAQDAKMTFSLKADNRAQVAINGVSTGPEIVGQANGINADAVFSQNLHPGENTITLNVGDEGGLNGFNFRIDLSVVSSRPLEIVPVVPPDITPPIISAPVSITREATGPSGALVNFIPAPTATDNVNGSVPVTATPSSGSLFALGKTVVQLSASDVAGNNASATFPVHVVDTTPPAIGSAPGVAAAEATGPSGAAVTFPVPSATDIVDGTVTVTASPASGSVFPLGSSTVTLAAKDSRNNAASKTFSVTVQDTTAPVIASITPSSATLWPPNHQMVAVKLTVVATDVVGVTSLKVLSVTSSEPDNGLGDGDTPNDIQFSGAEGDLTVNLRAERGGKGNGRIYTITIQAGDQAGNKSTQTCTVSVPKSQGGK